MKIYNNAGDIKRRYSTLLARARNDSKILLEICGEELCKLWLTTTENILTLNFL